MVKTTPLNDDTHTLLKDVQKTLRKRYSISMSIRDIVAHIIPNHEESVKKIINDLRNIKIDEHFKIDENNLKNSNLKIEKVEKTELKV